MERMTIGQIEAAINRARRAQPAVGHEASLSSDVALLASIYGLMIFHHQDEQVLAELAPGPRAALLRWVDRA
jgi:Protein of unknown function (DUF3717)